MNPLISSIQAAPAAAMSRSTAFVTRFVLPSAAVIMLALAAISAQCAAQAPGAPPTVPQVSADRAAKDGSVWGALIFANNAKATELDPKAIEDFPDLAKRLGKAFPFTNFELLGQHSQVVFREYESWVVPSKDVFLKVDSKGTAAKGGLNLHVQFWQGQQVLVKTDTLLQSNSPLFIGGPKWRDGRLIFVLLLKKVEADKGT